MISHHRNNPGRNGGYVIIILTILFAALSLIMVIGGAVPVVAHYAALRSYAGSKQAFYTGTSGVNDAIYRLKTGKILPAEVVIQISPTDEVRFTVETVPQGKRITATSTNVSIIRAFRATVSFSDGASFHYGIQSGNGGFVLRNSSAVIGNVFSNGAVLGEGNYIYGDIVSAGPNGLVRGIHATSSVWAHTIDDSIIDGNAYYASRTDTTVGGTAYPNSIDQDPVPLPIPDSLITSWENWASTDVATCNNGTEHQITTSITIGPKKYPCNLLIKGNDVVVTLAGPVWVEGNLETQTGPVIRMSEGLGIENVAIIADKPSDRRNSGIITIGQNTQFYSNGEAGTFVFTISGNTDSENGGTINAINIGQSAGALVAYSNHGQITLGQSVDVKEVTAYKIILTNTAVVEYDKGLPSVLFKAGPSGGYSLIDWLEL